LPLPRPPHAGKTTIIDTVAAELPGVVRVEVDPGASPKEIVNDTLMAITQFQFSFMSPKAPRVIAWHTRLFRMPPTVILHVGERTSDEKPASMGSTVRQLVDKYKLNVIVDSSNSSLDKMALDTERQRVLLVC
jgi:hypothetical protein